MKYRKSLLYILAGLVLSSRLLAAVAFDAGSLGANDATSVSHTVTGSDTILVIGVWCEGSRTVTAATYNGDTMTEVTNQLQNGDRLTVFYLLAPDTGTNTISVTLSSAGNARIAGASFTGVNQTTPYDSGEVVKTGVAQSGAADISVDVSGGATDELVVDFMGSWPATTGTPGAGQTLRTTACANAQKCVGISTEPGSASAVTMSWTVGNDWHRELISFGLKPVASATRRVFVVD